MSWLFAVSRKPGMERKQTMPQHERLLHTVSTSGVFLAIGGVDDTCFFERESDNQTGWAVVGTGIRLGEDSAAMLTRKDWAALLTAEVFDQTAIDGHFVALRWSGATIELFTDQLGLRTIFFGHCVHGICISTRLDWVAQETKQPEIDFGTLGSRWLMFNQLSQDSCIVGVKRLGPGGHAAFRDGDLISQTTLLWSPTFEPTSTGTARETLEKFIKCALDNSRLPSLGLSGGLDSRLLLAILLHLGRGRFTTHAFGHPSDPDVRIAGNLTEKTGVTLSVFNEPLPGIDECLRTIRSFALQTFLAEPCTSFFKLRYYPQLHHKNNLMVDGGYGEFSRRQFLNRVAILGKGALQSRNLSQLVRLMRSPRADIFSNDVIAIMEDGARGSLGRAIDEMPDVQKIGVENFVDLLTVRTKIPNSGGPEQARIDSQVLNFMPLVQPSFLKTIFGVPVTLRSNGAFHRSIIQSVSPVLSNLPLVKSGVTYRFGLPTPLSWLTTRAKAAGGFRYSDPMPSRVLDTIREYVLDLARSVDITSSPFYDREKINTAVEQYYKGNTHLRSTVDWWLTFDFWRNGLAASRSGGVSPTRD